MLTEDGERDLHADYGPWATRDERDAQQMLRGFTGDWWVVGGRAIEAFTGSPEPHKGIDNALLRADLPELRLLSERPITSGRSSTGQ